MANQREKSRPKVRVPASPGNQQRLEARIREMASPRNARLLSLFIYVEGAGRHADALVNRVVQQWELDSAQLSVLFALWGAPPPHRQSPTVLHRQLIQSPSGVSHTLRRLTNAGLTRRIRDPKDARSWHVELTPAGVEVARSAIDDLMSNLAEVFQGLTKTQLERLADAQRTIIELLAASELAYPASSRMPPVPHLPLTDQKPEPPLLSRRDGALGDSGCIRQPAQDEELPAGLAMAHRAELTAHAYRCVRTVRADAAHSAEHT